MEVAELLRITDRYVCAQCWGPVVVNREFEVVCPDCGAVGLHSKYFVERREQEDRARYLEVKYSYKHLGPKPTEPKLSEAELLNALGY